MSTQQLQHLVQQVVVLNTQGPLLYIGRLVKLDERGYWLEAADVHDRTEGHATNEQYVNDASLLEREGVRHVNRRRVFVERTAIVSVSALSDVVTDSNHEPEPGQWLP